MKNNRWFVVVNPKAGSGKCSKDWPEINRLLQKHFIFDYHFTEYRGHAIELISKAIEFGFYKFISVGGDGTLNEVVNGIFKSNNPLKNEVLLGVITVGTGNDWGRTHNMPQSYADMVKVIDKRKIFLHDVGKAKYRHAGEKESRYFLNIAGMGFDALVAKKVNKLKENGHGGIMVYMASLISGLFQFKTTKIKVSSAGNVLYDDHTFLVAIGICRYNGGGMKLLPDALPDDGLLDMTIIKKVPKLKVLANIKNVFDGSFVKLKEVKRFRASSFTIESEPPHSLHLETDGESLGLSPLDFDVLPRALKVIVP